MRPATHLSVDEINFAMTDGTESKIHIQELTVSQTDKHTYDVITMQELNTLEEQKAQAFAKVANGAVILIEDEA